LHLPLCLSPHILQDFAARPPLDLLLSHLGRLLPRYYSISSSQRTDARRVTVTAAVVRYETLGRQRKGVRGC
jgi:sulfite reductase alpha subunit-like flavoprotein